MDSTRLDYALMAGDAYFYKRKPVNQIPMPTGATLLGGGLEGRALSSGYECRAYNYGGKIVISFAGTYFPDGFLSGVRSGSISDNDAASLKDWGANINLGSGALDQQLKNAATFYEDVKRANPGVEIAFTGHSLGGGLAALMGVLFNKQAITFDPAPFRNAATMANALTLRDYLTAKGYPVDADLNSFSASQAPLGGTYPEVIAGLTAIVAMGGALIAAGVAALAALPVPVTIRGESNVKIVAVAGEFLTGNDFSDFRNRLRIGSGGNELVPQGGLGKLAGGEAHSISLLYLLGKSTAFQQLTTKLPELLPSLFDETMYRHSVDTPNQNFVERLLREEVGAAGVQSTTSSTGFLDKFVSDLGRITASEGTSANARWQKALTVAAMDYYYNKEATNATQLFKLESGAVHFDLKDINATTLKSLPLLKTAASSTATGGDPFVGGAEIANATAWHVQTGGGTMDWEDHDSVNDVAVGGAERDILRGGQGEDVLIGGGGNDTLEGGEGSDVLQGSAGDDTLYGGADNDTLWGDTAASNITAGFDASALWGNDFLDGALGDDRLIGGGKDDTLLGGTGVIEHQRICSNACTWRSRRRRWNAIETIAQHIVFTADKGRFGLDNLAERYGATTAARTHLAYQRHARAAARQSGKQPIPTKGAM